MSSHSEPASAPVVVGIDGASDPEPGPELSWAATEALRRRTSLRLVHAIEWNHVSAVAVAGGGADVDALAQQYADEVVRRAEEYVRRDYPGLASTTTSSVGSPARLLIEQSNDAKLLVIGSRGHGRLRGILTASVGYQVAGQVCCPLVVVPAQRHTTTDRLVVGIDASAAAAQVLAYAFAEASLRHATLVVAHAGSVPSYAWAPPVPVIVDWALVDEQMASVVDEHVRPWQRKYPDVAVERVFTPGEPLPLLLDQARRADLLIVGSRGRGGFASLTLGSVSHAVLHSTESTPVVVVSTGGAAAGSS